MPDTIATIRAVHCRIGIVYMIHPVAVVETDEINAKFANFILVIPTPTSYKYSIPAAP